MPSPLRAALATLLLAAALAPPAEAASPTVVSAYAYFQPATGGLAQYDKGNVFLIFRSNRPLRQVDGNLQVLASVDGQDGAMFTISRSEHCYGARVRVEKGGALGAGSRVRVRIGNLVDRRFTVQPRRDGYPLGGLLGCTNDPKTRAAYSGLTQLPEFEPHRIFYSANAGPYVKDLRWKGWGTARAVGAGTYISDCASCGPAERLPARVVLTGRKYFADDGYTYYTHECLKKFNDGHWTGRDVATRKPC